MPKAPYKQILPLPADSTIRARGHEPPVPKRSRITTTLACDMCRARKSRCDGARPRCMTCKRKDTRCSYAAESRSRAPTQDHGDILYRLKNAPESEALELLRRLRATGNASAALASAQGSMHDIYSVDLGRLLGPSRRSSFVNLESLPQEFGATPSNQSLDVLTVASTPMWPDDHSDVSGPQIPHYCDPRLHQLEIGYWTRVPISNELAAGAISMFLETNHPVLGFFDADVFLNDLIDHKLQFCSAFLVHALLSYACQSYTSVEPKAGPISDALFAATAILWRAERASNSIINVAALTLFSLACHTQVSDIGPLEILNDVRKMAERLKLYGLPHTAENATAFARSSPEQQRVTAHIAWGSFNWITLNALYCPLQPAAYCPMFPIPGDAPVPEAHGRALFPAWPTHHVPYYVGNTFPKICKFFQILHEVAVVYSASGRNSIPLGFAEAKYQKLLDWSDSLSQDMSSLTHDLSHVLVFHMLFHAAVIDIFRPFDQGGGQPQKLQSFSAQDSSTQTVLRASTDRLKRLLLTCQLHNPRALLCAVSNAGVIHVGNSMLHYATAAKQSQPTPDDTPNLDSERSDLVNLDPDWRFYFLVCMASCKDMITCFPVFKTLGQGLLSMAVRDGALTSSEASKLLGSLREAGNHRDGASGEYLGEFFLDFNLAATAPEEAQAVAVARQFEDLTVFNEFTDGSDYVVP